MAPIRFTSAQKMRRICNRKQTCSKWRRMFWTPIAADTPMYTVVGFWKVVRSCSAEVLSKVGRGLTKKIVAEKVVRPWPDWLDRRLRPCTVYIRYTLHRSDSRCVSNTSSSSSSSVVTCGNGSCRHGRRRLYSRHLFNGGIPPPLQKNIQFPLPNGCQTVCSKSFYGRDNE